MTNGVYIVTFYNFTITNKSYTDKDRVVKLLNPHEHKQCCTVIINKNYYVLKINYMIEQGIQ